MTTGTGPHPGNEQPELKLLLTTRLLRLRRDRPELFGREASYAPLASSSHLLGFVRSSGDGAVATVVRLESRSREAAVVELPAGRWVNEFTGVAHPGGVVPGSDVLLGLPVAVLVKEGDA